MSLAQSQGKVLLRLLAQLRPHWRSDRALPARLQQIFAGNRSFGSRDRRLYRELVYTALRYLPWVEDDLAAQPAAALRHLAWLSGEIPATAGLRAALCGDLPPVPDTVAARAAVLRKDPAAVLPEWAARHCPEAALAPNLDFLLRRAPLWIRLASSTGGGWEAEFADQQIAWSRAPAFPSALRVATDFDLTRTAAFAAGEFEVQDIGSQAILELAPPLPGEQWLDACAGAGGKTLQLAAGVGPEGGVDAHDIRPAALAELEVRRARRGLTTIRPLAVLPEKSYDGVLVDAPCSGSGTWRRAPHLKWTTSAGDVAAAAARQQQILATAAPRVRPGGRLVYATCSLSHVENEHVVRDFLRHHPAFADARVPPRAGLTPREFGQALLPASLDGDGFYFAVLPRAAS